MDPKIITDYLIDATQEKSRLLNLLNTFNTYNNFVFYSDGSVKDISLPSCRLGFGWIQTRKSIPDASYFGTTIFMPSSTKAEAFAILTILLVCPSYFSIKIMTDSANCINTFYSFVVQKTPLSPRKKFKQINFLVWFLILQQNLYKSLYTKSKLIVMTYITTPRTISLKLDSIMIIQFP